MSQPDRQAWIFALSWAVRWYQASMGWDSSWLVLVIWVATWGGKKWWQQRKKGGQ